VPADTPDNYVLHLRRGRKTPVETVQLPSFAGSAGVASIGRQSWLRVPRIDQVQFFRHRHLLFGGHDPFIAPVRLAGQRASVLRRTPFA
jgi:hypothetical protein